VPASAAAGAPAIASISTAVAIVRRDMFGTGKSSEKKKKVEKKKKGGSHSSRSVKTRETGSVPRAWLNVSN
jgi:hypothetical protein